MSDKKYTVSEISQQFGDNVRQVQRKLKDLIKIDGGKYLIDERIVDMLYPETTHDNNTEVMSYDVVEGFSEGEYAEFKKRLIEYPRLKEDVEYYKRSAESHQRQMEKVLNIMLQRNIKGYLPLDDLEF